MKKGSRKTDRYELIGSKMNKKESDKVVKLGLCSTCEQPVEKECENPMRCPKMRTKIVQDIM